MSILTSMKKLLGITEEYSHFDTDIIIHINSIFSILTQLGVGPEDGFSISDATETWSEYLLSDKRIEMIKTFMYLKLKLIFDPPVSSGVIEAMNKTINELEWRILIQKDPRPIF